MKEKEKKAKNSEKKPPKKKVASLIFDKVPEPYRDPKSSGAARG